MRNEETKFMDEQCNPMYVQGVRTIMNSDPTGPQRFGQSWPDGPDGGGPHRFTNTAVPRFDGHHEVERVVATYGGPTVVCTPG